MRKLVLIIVVFMVGCSNPYHLSEKEKGNLSTNISVNLSDQMDANCYLTDEILSTEDEGIYRAPAECKKGEIEEQRTILITMHDDGGYSWRVK